MECVFRNPTKFGFTNTRNMAPSPSAKGYLYGYNDRYHFGAAGQKLISRVVGYYLGAGNVSPARLVSDMAAGRVLGVPCS